ncbi:MAG TPA: trimeric intracellular cation channel family protein [Vicinamibacterales bacterium]|nr:trimeric intracellular cation channel family protein [Vicinamibacterales bacterium]
MTLLLALDLVGTFVFALAGATAGARRGLDIFGVAVLSFATACSGGIARDLLIGAVPPAALSDWRYGAAALLAGLMVFRWYGLVCRMQHPVRVFDAAGLALFAVTGAHKSLAFGLHPLMAALLGMLTGIGGSLVRDILLAQVPMVLRSDLYAVAALAGAGVVAIGSLFGLAPMVTALAGALLCFVLRMIAIHQAWELPKARITNDSGEP